MKEMFESLSVRELMASIVQIADLIDLYDTGLTRENAFLAVTAQNELARRGEFDTIISVLSIHVAEGNLKLGSDFTRVLSESLISLGDCSAVLKEAGKKIRAKAQSSEKNTLLLDDLQTTEDDIPDNFYGIMKALIGYGYDEEDLTQMIKNFYENKIPFPCTA